jgi:arginine decarboxylase
MEKFIFLRELEEYVSRGLTPLHMPGHKRRVEPGPGLPYSIDLTEVDGTDDLHDARGMIERAQERTAALYGAERTFYLVNGSTCGILAAVRAAAGEGGEIIAARNCHRSVFNAAELCALGVRWLYPPVIKDFGVFGSIRPADVEAALTDCPAARCVIITSPTYEGVVSDIKAIAGACHARGVPLIVDEAHGAHLGLPGSGMFPAGAVECGADAVIQSAHKTLPSLTQTAWMHLNGSLISERELRRQLDVFETSSPSYPLMASLDGCTGIMREDGKELLGRWNARLEAFYAAAGELKNLRVFDGEEKGVFAFDRGKILVNGGLAGLTGAELARLLREKYGFETEMACGGNVLAMTSCCDADDTLTRFASALAEIDDNARGGASTASSDPPEAGECVCSISRALSAPAEDAEIQNAEGRTAAEYVWAYPPGVPICVPGEVITPENVEYISAMAASGTPLRHSHAENGLFRVLCVDNGTVNRVN